MISIGASLGLCQWAFSCSIAYEPESPVQGHRSLSVAVETQAGDDERTMPNRGRPGNDSVTG